jgi:hypothetical protein
MIVKRMILALIVAAIVASPITISGAQKSGSDNGGSMDASQVKAMAKMKVLEGSWLGTADLGFFQFKFLITFNEDGGLVSTQAPYLQTPFGTTTWSGAHGEWKMVSKGVFSFTFLALVHDVGGTFLFAAKVNATIEVDETMNIFSGSAITVNLDGDGNEITPRQPANITGKRIRVEA